MSDAIGTVTLPSGEVVTLGRDLRWTCPDQTRADIFSMKFDARLEGLECSAGLPLGYRTVAAAAEWSGGTATLPELPNDPGVVY